MSVLPIGLKTKRQSSRVRKGPHFRSHLLWQILVGTLVFDPLIPLLWRPPLPTDVADTIAITCALTTLPFLAQGFIHTTLSRLRRIHSRNLEENARYVPIILSLVVVGVAAIKLMILLNLPFPLRLLLLAVVLHGIVTSMKKLKRQDQETTTLFKTNPWAKLQQWERQLIVFTVTPLLLARAVSISGALAEPTSMSPSVHSVYLCVSALLLFMLRPDRNLFMGTCKTCKHPVPIAFEDLGSCLNCDPQVRLAYNAWINKLPYSPPVPDPADEKAQSPHRKKQTSPTSSPRALGEHISPQNKKITSKKDGLPLKPR